MGPPAAGMPRAPPPPLRPHLLHVGPVVKVIGRGAAVVHGQAIVLVRERMVHGAAHLPGKPQRAAGEGGQQQPEAALQAQPGALPQEQQQQAGSQPGHWLQEHAQQDGGQGGDGGGGHTILCCHACRCRGHHRRITPHAGFQVAIIFFASCALTSLLPVTTQTRFRIHRAPRGARCSALTGRSTRKVTDAGTCLQLCAAVSHRSVADLLFVVRRKRQVQRAGMLNR